ncbi:hypothetical protein [Aquabacter spiritensis]|uniref:Phasin protein n=1 Tax=Aquabacter spiritensis TaxID=933073 RepID=A0A4R3LXC8_9HYPH|nr:hypothetical protein [Aquabacter spiritensis]TCT03237.1 hypothetical protein EDC64_110101 [Aquabacter spiritensis]
MPDNPAFQAWAQAWQGATPPAAWPMTAARTLWVDLPMEAATRLQRLGATQMQEQMRLFAQLSTLEGGEGNPMMKEIAFLQQSSLAWGSELLQIMELYHERLLNPTRQDPDAPIAYPKAA